MYICGQEEEDRDRFFKTLVIFHLCILKASMHLLIFFHLGINAADFLGHAKFHDPNHITD